VQGVEVKRGAEIKNVDSSVDRKLKTLHNLPSSVLQTKRFADWLAQVNIPELPEKKKDL